MGRACSAAACFEDVDCGRSVQCRGMHARSSLHLTETTDDRPRRLSAMARLHPHARAQPRCRAAQTPPPGVACRRGRSNSVAGFRQTSTASGSAPQQAVRCRAAPRVAMRLASRCPLGPERIDLSVCLGTGCKAMFEAIKERKEPDTTFMILARSAPRRRRIPDFSMNGSCSSHDRGGTIATGDLIARIF